MLSGLRLGIQPDLSDYRNDFFEDEFSNDCCESKVATTPNTAAWTFDGERRGAVSATSPTGSCCSPQPWMAETGRAIDPLKVTRGCRVDDSWSCGHSPASSRSASSTEEDDAFFKSFWTIGSQHTTESSAQRIGGCKRSFAAEFSGADDDATLLPTNFGIVLPMSAEPQCVTTTSTTSTVANRKRTCRVR